MEEYTPASGWLAKQLKAAHREVHRWYYVIEILQLVKMEISDKDLLEKLEKELKYAEKYYEFDLYRYKDYGVERK